MSACVPSEMATHLRMLAEPMQRGDSVQSCIERAARRAGLSFTRAKRIWYGETRLIRAEEADMIRASAAAVRARQDHLRHQLAEMDSLLQSIRPEGLRPCR